MMKRTFLLSCLALLAVAGRVQAQSVTVDGITYMVNVDGQTAAVTGHEGTPVDVVIPATVNIGGTDYPVAAIEEYAFQNCVALQGITLPEGLLSIGYQAFYGCDALRSIISHAATPPAIEEGTFYKEAYLTATLTVPQGAEAAYRAAEYWGWFWNTTQDGITYGLHDNGQSAISIDADENITVANIPATVAIGGTNYSVTAIGNKVFHLCSALQSITLPEGLQTIGYQAFYSCDALRSIISHAATPPAIEEYTFYKEAYLTATLTVPQGAEAAYRAAEYWGWFWNTTQEGITYGIHGNGQSACAIDCTINSVDVAIPATVNIEGTDYPVTAIGEYAFSDCDALQSITLPEGLQTIGESAFYGCDALRSITLSEGVQSIGSRAFASCDALQSITLPEGLQTIGKQAFAGCSNLQSITLPEGLQTIGEYAFSDCDALQGITLPEGLQTIGERAFYSCDALQSITLPEGLQTIGEYAFSDCDALQGITLPEGLQTIGERAFYSCDALQSVTFPEGLQTIGEYAFSDCTALQSIISHVATPPAIYESTFDKNAYITASLTVPQGAEAAYRTAEYWEWFYNATIDGITYGLHDSGQSAFVFYADPNITAANVTAAVSIDGAEYPVNAIGTDVFSGCTSLRSVTLPEGLQSIGNSAFYECSSLQSIDIPQGVAEIDDDAFYQCTALENITFPEGLQTIGSGAFSGCTALQSITLPKGLQSIGDSTFYYCSSLQNITFPEGLQSIGNNAFSGCFTLQSITIPEGLLSIGKQAFAYCSNLQSITLPEGLLSIGEGVFGVCTSLTSIDLPQGLQTIDYEAFCNCNALQSITIPQSVTEIGSYAFSGCSSLQSITLLEGLQSIGEMAFNCSALQSITLPEGLQSIGDGAFGGCTALTNIAIPQGITKISNSTFFECSALQNIILPENLQSISYFAFKGCPLKDITCLAATPPTFEDNTFEDEIYTNAILHVPAEAWAAYQADFNWKRLIRYPNIGGVQYYIDFATQEASVTDADTGITSAAIPATVEHEGTSNLVTAIGSSAFYGCDALQSITLPKGVTSIGSYAFQNCNALQNIDIPEEVTTISYKTFYGCSNLQSITLPEGVTSIGDYAFYNCNAMQGITIPEGVIYIGSSTFSGCRSLTSIDLPSTIQKIGSGAFKDTGLRDVYSRAVTPPSIYDDTFSQSTYRLATLHVPAEALESYRSAMGWVLFDNIESDLPPVSIEDVAADVSIATYANGILTTESPASITVYAQNGAVVRHATDATSLSLEGLPRGIYIICVAQGRQQQVMKVIR